MTKKEILFPEIQKENFLNEVEVMKSVHHPFIAHFFDFFESEQHYFIAMEYCPNETLESFIKKTKKLMKTMQKGYFFN
jgi:serine/threonine protein kinase